MVIAPTFQILILLFISFEVSKRFSNQTFKNFLNRQSYNKYIFNIYKCNIKFIFLIPLFILFTIIFSFILSKEFNASYIFSLDFINLYFLIPLLQSILYINIVMLCILGSKNFIITFVKKLFSIYRHCLYMWRNKYYFKKNEYYYWTN